MAACRPRRSASTCRCGSFNGITQSRHSRLAVPMKRSQCALACGARTGVLSTCSDIESRESSTAGEDGVAIVYEVIVAR